MDYFHGEIDIIKKKIEISDDKAAIKTYNVLLEALQNLHHNAIGNVDVRVWLTDEGYISATRNIIRNEAISAVENKLVRINSLERNALREWRKDVINKRKMKEGEGAGVGLIDIAIKSRNKISYSFDKIDDDFSFFSLETKVNKEASKVK